MLSHHFLMVNFLSWLNVDVDDTIGEPVYFGDYRLIGTLIFLFRLSLLLFLWFYLHLQLFSWLDLFDLRLLRWLIVHKSIEVVIEQVVDVLLELVEGFQTRQFLDAEGFGALFVLLYSVLYKLINRENLKSTEIIDIALNWGLKILFHVSIDINKIYFQ